MYNRIRHNALSIARHSNHHRFFYPSIPFHSLSCCHCLDQPLVDHVRRPLLYIIRPYPSSFRHFIGPSINFVRLFIRPSVHPTDRQTDRPSLRSRPSVRLSTSVSPFICLSALRSLARPYVRLFIRSSFPRPSSLSVRSSFNLSIRSFIRVSGRSAGRSSVRPSSVRSSVPPYASNHP